MKKIIFNEWTFVLSILVFLSMCFISTHYSNNDFYDIVINFFAGMMLVALVISMLITNLIPNRLKMIVYSFFVLMLILSLTSCGRKNVPNIKTPTKREINKAMKFAPNQ